MNTLFTKIKQLDPMLAVSLTLSFAIGLLVGQQSVRDEAVATSNPYKALTLSTCTTDYECNIAQLLDDQANGRFVSTDDPIFFPDSVPVIEPIDYEQGESPSDYEQGESPSDYEQGESPSDYEQGESPSDYEQGESPSDYEQGESPSDYEQGESPSDYEQGESPSECEAGDKECLKQNANAGKPAHYPSICEPYIFPNEHKERNL